MNLMEKTSLTVSLVQGWGKDSSGFVVKHLSAETVGPCQQSQVPPCFWPKFPTWTAQSHGQTQTLEPALSPGHFWEFSCQGAIPALQ